MKKTSLAVIGIAVLLVQTVSAQVLYTTTNDFSLWQTANGFAQGPVTFPDSDGSIFNGLGNTNAPAGRIRAERSLFNGRREDLASLSLQAVRVSKVLQILLRHYCSPEWS